jgi:hypothetical protein
MRLIRSSRLRHGLTFQFTQADFIQERAVKNLLLVTAAGSWKAQNKP